MKPKFLCAGFAKCGTTTLHDILRQHPDIFLPEIKEPPFFEEPQLFIKGATWFEHRYFDTKDKYKIAGEIHPHLSVRKVSVKKLASVFPPDTKLIFMMRNPVEMFFSEYKMHLRFGHERSHANLLDKIDEKKELELYLKRHRYDKEKTDSLIRTGLYYNYIKNLLTYFSIDNCKFIIFEDFIKRQEECIKEILDFIGIDSNVSLNYDLRSNEGNKSARNALCANIIQSCFNLRLNLIKHTKTSKYDEYINKAMDVIFNLCLAESKEKSHMSDYSRKILENYYRNDKNEIKKMLNKNLDDLWYK